MSFIRKAGCVLLGIAAFVVTTLIFMNILDDRFSLGEPETASQVRTAQYHLNTAETTEPEETEAETEPVAVETETLPAETVAGQAVARKQYDAVPRYFQTDYSDIRFGSGTMATSGSGITSLAMVALSQLT